MKTHLIYTDFASWLVQQGITSISLNPDVAIRTQVVIAKAEAELSHKPPLWATSDVANLGRQPSSSTEAI